MDLHGDSANWSWGVGAQYGKRTTLKDGFFYEPHASLYIGRVDKNDYTLSNEKGETLGITEDGYRTVLGKAGVKFGKNFQGKGNVYGKIAYGKEFDGPNGLSQHIGSYSRRLDTAGGGDGWWEWSLGGEVKISPTGTLNLDYTRTTGSNIGDNWVVSGGLRFTWDGWGFKKDPFGEEIDYLRAFPKANSPTVVIGKNRASVNAKMQQAAAAIANSVEQAAENPSEELGARSEELKAADENTVASLPLQNFANSQSSVPNLNKFDKSIISSSLNFTDNGKDKTKSDTLNSADTGETSESTPNSSLLAPNSENLGVFELEGLTVEGKRPDWEKALSPGQVSVIYTEPFEGEQKSLPDLIDRVPGLFVEKMNGDGHYTTARVRGSTAAQVDVYIDGVKANLTGDAAVNLEAIPAENVERIEVYRGYIPARFAGAPMGGVINIVTKKPKELHGKITQGMKSYGGWNQTLEVSTPAGSGSLMFTYGRDIWHGNFDWIHPRFPQYNPGSDYTYHEKSMERRSNGYQNSDAMLKWQDEHWTVKGTWRKKNEQLAQATQTSVQNALAMAMGYFDAEQKIDYHDFMIKRRDTIGNLDFGWHLAYIDSKKSYTNTGLRKAYRDGRNKGYIEVGDKHYTYPTKAGATPGLEWSEYHSKKWNANLNAAMKAGRNHLLELNADLIWEKMDCNGNNWNITDTGSGSGNLANFRKMYDQYNNKEVHLTLQDTVTLNSAGDFKLTPIVRADKVVFDGIRNSPEEVGSGGKYLNPISDDANWHYSYGLALQKQLDDHWSFKTTYGTYQHHPNFYQIFGDGGFIGQNRALLVTDESYKDFWETGRQFDFSLNWQGKALGAETDTILTYFARHSENQMVLITQRGGQGSSYYAPLNEIRATGFELSHTMKWNRLSLSLAATHQKSRNLEEEIKHNWNVAGAGAFVPEWVWTARLDYAFPKDKLAVFAEYKYTGMETLRGRSSDVSGDYDAQYREAYSLLNLGLKYRFNKMWRMSFGINDILDKGKRVYTYGPPIGGGGNPDNIYPNSYPLTGRTYYATLECSF